MGVVRTGSARSAAVAAASWAKLTGTVGGRNVGTPTAPDLLAQDRRRDRAGDDPAGLALLDARADRRVALDVLDRCQAGPERPLQVAHGRVALEVDVMGRPRVLGRGPGRRHDPGRGDPAQALDLAGGGADDLDVCGRVPSGTKAAMRVVEAERAAGVGPEGHVRVPATGDEQQVRLDGLLRAVG